MTGEATATRFAYDPAALRHGEGAVAGLADEIAARDRERALVVTGETVGTTPAVMDPVRDGLGDRLAGTFAETTPEKRLSTAIAGAEAVAEYHADALVAVGGGSSLDVAKAVATVAASDRAPRDLAAAFERTGTLPVPADALPIVAVPTTFAGADQSQGAGLTASPAEGLVDEHVDGGLWAGPLHPVAAVYDPALFATTPRRILAGSAMNGFDKGIETLYSRHATPVTDATAARGVARFREGLLAFEDGGVAGTDGGAGGADGGAGGEDGGAAAPDGDATDADGEGAHTEDADHRNDLAAATEGLLLVQYGISRAEATTLGPIHAVGQALSSAGVHQGTAHAIVAPHVLELVLEHADASDDVRPDLLASALGAPVGEAAGDVDDPASAAVERVAAVRDALGVPTRLRDVDAVAEADLPDVAAAVADHRFLANGPRGVEPTEAEWTALLERAW